jgi:hypothetical protein
MEASKTPPSPVLKNVALGVKKVQGRSLPRPGEESDP